MITESWLNLCKPIWFHSRTGIYIPAEGFGIRLEDDLVIQESGEPFNLMRNIPIEGWNWKFDELAQ
jgi:Xaa-Pro aminopeptidase